MKTLKVVAAVIEKDDQILIAQRLKGDLAGLWEFPGGKYEPGETGIQAISREIKEEFDCDTTVNSYLCTVKHQYETFLLEMDCYICTLLTQSITLHDHSSIRWINPFDNDVDWVAADIKVIEEYRKTVNKDINSLCLNNKRRNKMIAIVNGKVVTVTQGTIENGTVLIDNGRIVGVGENIPVPATAEIIDATGKWVTPGFIDAHSHISTFNEPQAIPANYDGNETSSPITAEVRGVDALNPKDMAIGISRRAGFTTCYTGPGSANVIGGTGFSFKLKEGETCYDLVIPGSEMMKMALGENPKRVYGGKGVKPSTRMGVASVLRETLRKAKNYSDALIEAETDPTKKPKPNFQLDALVPVVRGEMKVRIHCHRNDDIVTAIRISEEFGLDYSLEHVTEGPYVAKFLASKDPDMVIGPLTMDPAKMEIWNASLSTPAKMEAAGCTRFSLMQDTSSGTKYLPTFIGLCIARGLSQEMAMKSVTINPATMLGISNKVGSIEIGKDADLAIWTGNPFCNFTLCEKTIIDGEVYENEPF